jgi:hypothetical protein
MALPLQFLLGVTPLKPALALFILVAPGVCEASDEVPVDFQATLFKKILLFDRSLSRNESNKIAIPYTENVQGKAEELVAAFTRVGIEASGFKTKSLTNEKLLAALAESTIVYVTNPMSAEANSYCYSNKKLTIAGEPGLVQSGHASIAIAKKTDGKPLILVNLKRLKSEGHEFSSDLLNLAQVVD